MKNFVFTVALHPDATGPLGEKLSENERTLYGSWLADLGRQGKFAVGIYDEDINSWSDKSWHVSKDHPRGLDVWKNWSFYYAFIKKDSI